MFRWRKGGIGSDVSLEERGKGKEERGKGKGEKGSDVSLEERGCYPMKAVFISMISTQSIF